MELFKETVILFWGAMFLTVIDSSKDVSYEIRQNFNYCSFFNNRAPTAQPGLKNCTWFKENSCCLQQEIETTFASVKPLKGALLSCQKYLNYLMCYICAPNQHIFYQNERLTVCQDFCDKFYQACDTAILKGSPIKDLYSSGKEFCLSRRFLVSNSNCFNFDPALDTSRASKHCSSFAVYLFLLTIICLNNISMYSAENILYNNMKSKRKNEVIQSVVKSSCQHSQEMSQTRGSFCGTMIKIILVCVSLIIIQTQVVTSQSTVSNLSENRVKTWAESLENVLSDLAKQGLQYNHLEDTFSTVQYESQEVDGTLEIMKIRHELVDIFAEKQGLAVDLAEEVSQLYESWKHEYSANNITHLSELPLAVYKDADLISHFPLDQCIYDRRFKADVLLDSSVVKLADDSDRSNKDIIDVVQLTASLDETFSANLQDHPDIRWQYFGSKLGVHRSYPGKERMRNFVGFTEDFDPRSRPWYLSATSGTKDVVIVLDVSSSMAENHRLSVAREVIQWILDTMTKEDRVNIVLSRSSHWDSKGVKHEYTAEVVGCQKSGLLQATSNTRKELLTSLQNVVAKGGSNHTEAFQLAFDLLGFETFRGEGVCNPLILFITDSDLRDGPNRCSRGYHKHYHDGTKEFVAGKLCEYTQETLGSLVNELQGNSTQKARVLTFVVEEDIRDKSSVTPSLAHMTCGNDGVLVTLDQHTDIYQSMQPYFDFLKDSTGPQQAVWTSPYLDKYGLGLMMTVSVPVISKTDNSVLGVVGLDVPLDKIENLLRHRMWGDVYSFLVDRGDLAAIVHPYAKPTGQLLEEPVFTPVIELETHQDKPADFTRVVQGILKAETGEVTITRDAVRPVSEQVLLWKPVSYTRYIYTDIPDSDFSIVLNLGMSGASYLYKEGVEMSNSTSYLSDMDSYAKYIMDMPGAYEILNSTTNSPKYEDVKVSREHSVVHLTPRAFCQPHKYILGSPNFTQLHTYINSAEEQSEDCVTGTYRRDVWSDVQLTTHLEPFWASRGEAVSDSVLWTFVATESGVMRIYPGVKIHKTYDPTLRAWYRGSREGSSVHTSHVYLNTLPHTTKVVTFSKSVKRPAHCTGHTPCPSDSVQAVVAMDLSYSHLESLVLGLRTQFSNKYCGMSYSCGQGDSCETRCYLVTKASYLTYADDISELSDWPKEKYEAVSLASRHGYVFNVLVKAGVFIRHERLNYQGVCKRFPDMHANAQPPTFQDDSLRRKGPIPKFANKYSCIKEAVFYQASEEILSNKSFVLSGDLRDDPCGDGQYFFVTLPSMGLFLLVLEDYRPAQRSNINCHITNRVVMPGSHKLEREICPTNVRDRYGVRQCTTPDVDIECGWSRASVQGPLYSLLVITSMVWSVCGQCV